MLITVPRVVATAVGSVTLAVISAIGRLAEPSPQPIPIPAMHPRGPRVLPARNRHPRRLP